MKSWHNLGTVVRFEIVRNLQKVSFWLFALGFPLLMVAILGVAYLANASTADAEKQLSKQKFSIAITDSSGVVNPEIIKAMNIETIEPREVGIDRVKSGKLDAFFYYPKDLTKQPIQVFARDVGIFDNSRYGSVAHSLLYQSVATRVEPAYQLILQNNLKQEVTTFRDGVVSDGIKEMILPGLFMVLFYFLIGFFGNQMLNSTVEEKENRTVEMLLATVRADTLITGKILSMIVLALIQATIIVLPMIALYVVASSQVSGFDLGIDLSNLPVDPLRIGLAVGIFTGSFILFTGLLVVVGAMMPTAKEASQWFGLFVMMIFVPLYGAPAFISNPDILIVRVLSLFPLTSPIPLMLRNAVGNLSISEALLGIAILVVSGALVIWLGIRAFRYGAIQYDSRLSLSALRAKRQGDKL